MAPMSLRFLVSGARRKRGCGPTAVALDSGCTCLLLGLAGAPANVLEVVGGIRLDLLLGRAL